MSDEGLRSAQVRTVAMVTPYPPEPDGIGLHTSDLIDELRRLVDIRVIAPAKGLPDSWDGNVEVRRLVRTSPVSGYKLFRSLTDGPTDVVHYQFAISTWGVSAIPAILAGMAARRRSGTRVMITLHEVVRDVEILPFGHAVYGLIARSADGVIVCTTEARQILVSKCGIDPDRVVVMALGLRTSTYKGLNGADAHGLRQRLGVGNRDIVLAFGFLHPDKGYEHLFGAVAALVADRPHLRDRLAVVVAGQVRSRSGVFRWFERKDRAYERHLHASVDRLGLHDVVRFTGYVPDGDVEALFAAAAVTVFPYTKTSQSGVLTRAISAQSLIVASDLPGLREAADNGALYADPGSERQLAEQIAVALQGGPVVAEVRKNLIEVRDRSGHDRVAAALVANYARLGRGQPSAPADVGPQHG